MRISFGCESTSRTNGEILISGSSFYAATNPDKLSDSDKLSVPEFCNGAYELRMPRKTLSGHVWKPLGDAPHLLFSEGTHRRGPNTTLHS
jgi:hypothetical protein